MSPPGKRRHNELNAAPPPETPGERVRPVAAATEMLCTAEKVSAFGAKSVSSASRTERPDLAFPSRGWAYCRVLLYRQRFCDCVRANPFFFLRRKKNSEKERPLRGLRREVRFIMSPPGKRRHNELNAAPPPETPGNGCDRWRQRQRCCAQRRTFLHSGQKTFVSCPRGTIPLWLPLEGCEAGARQ